MLPQPKNGESVRTEGEATSPKEEPWKGKRKASSPIAPLELHGPPALLTSEDIIDVTEDDLVQPEESPTARKRRVLTELSDTESSEEEESTPTMEEPSNVNLMERFATGQYALELAIAKLLSVGMSSDDVAKAVDNLRSVGMSTREVATTMEEEKLARLAVTVPEKVKRKSSSKLREKKKASITALEEELNQANHKKKLGEQKALLAKSLINAKNSLIQTIQAERDGYKAERDGYKAERDGYKAALQQVQPELVSQLEQQYQQQQHLSRMAPQPLPEFSSLQILPLHQASEIMQAPIPSPPQFITSQMLPQHQPWETMQAPLQSSPKIRNQLWQQQPSSILAQQIQTNQLGHQQPHHHLQQRAEGGDSSGATAGAGAAGEQENIERM